MTEKEKVLNHLINLGISFEIVEHPPTPTIEDVMKYWTDHDAVHCKNLFFRNHKGNRHYLVILDCKNNLAIRDLEQRLRQGKISFASEKRLTKYLGLKPGSVSPFGLINDIENHIHLYIDKNLQLVEKISFHPNDNTASLVLSFADFIIFLENSGNNYEFLNLYDE